MALEASGLGTGGEAYSACSQAGEKLSLALLSLPISCTARSRMESWMRLFLGSDTAKASRATVMSGPSALSRMPPVRCSGGVTSAMNTARQTVTGPGRTSPT